MPYMYYLFLLLFIVLIIYFIFLYLPSSNAVCQFNCSRAFLKASTFLADTRLLMTLAAHQPCLKDSGKQFSTDSPVLLIKLRAQQTRPTEARTVQPLVPTLLVSMCGVLL